MTETRLHTARQDLAAVADADEIVLFVCPWADPMDGESLTSVVCAPGDVAIVEDGRFGPEIRVAGQDLVVTLGYDDHIQNDAYLILPRVRLAGSALDEALALVHDTLAEIHDQNDGRCGHVWNRFDNREVQTSDIAIGETIVLPSETFAASDLMKVCAFRMSEDGDREESSVEMFFADGRAARLRGGMDWFNAMC